MNHGRNSSILTAYATLFTVAFGLIAIDSRIRGSKLPDLSAETPAAIAKTLPAASSPLVASKQQTASASTAQAPTL